MDYEVHNVDDNVGGEKLNSYACLHRMIIGVKIFFYPL